MSRIGKKFIFIPKGVRVRNLRHNYKEYVLVDGPKGKLSRLLPPFIRCYHTYYMSMDGDLEQYIALDIVNVSNKKRMQTLSKRFFGLTRTLIDNMITGVSLGFDKRLRLSGVGYKVHLEGRDLILNVGYSHPVKIVVPQELNVYVESPTSLLISGFQKDVVGEFASKIRSIRPPEPYNGKGIFYENETIKRKVGKRAK